ncbi:MutS-related protein [Vagococcus elongatus]|uniref:DNA mismatch repair proteins mutS family domain-containing protein n=1 Tax=Vagococcus elongatus TaxID=180344 RepID=A0A430AND7_9ENTE|nr:DNA mismatch repair protein MutS [Vagococcus elongatus]RSU09444.1 hypothetical protein CBF29_11375 [Vagococcus elongatus]
MNEKIMMGILAIGIVGFILFVSWRDQQRLKEKIKREWGKVPKSTAVNVDDENSLYEVWQLHVQKKNLTALLDDTTWYDLDLSRLFKVLNGTRSSIGAEWLYSKLRQNDYRQKEQKDFRQLVDFFYEHQGEREKMQFALAKVGKKNENHVWKYLYDDDLSFIKHSWLFYLAGGATLVSLLLFLFTFEVVFGVLTLFLVCVNMGTYYYYKGKLETELVVMGYLVNVLSTPETMKKLDFPFKKEMTEYAKLFNSVRKVGFSFRVKGDTDAEVFFEYLNMMFMVPFISYNIVVDKIKKYRQEATALVELLGAVDAAIAVANFQKLLPYYCRSEFISDKKIQGQGVYHPMLTEPVANDVSLEQFNLVTGSNASGKSTYVKSVAINAILSQTFGIACAESWQMHPGEIYTSMAIKDDIFKGESYFISEIKSVRRIIRVIENGHFCYAFVDEILKGTNTIERIASSSHIVEWLSRQDCLGYVATHDIELTEILGEKCHNIHFREVVMDDGDITFDYRLHQGPSQTRNAIALLERLDYPKEIVRQAIESASAFEKSRQWH